jgi:hypothetical protein
MLRSPHFNIRYFENFQNIKITTFAKRRWAHGSGEWLTEKRYHFNIAALTVIA